MENNTFIVKANRTPVGSFGGSLAEFTSPQLGSEVIKSIINDNQIDSNKIDEVIMGNVLSAGIGQAPARQASIFSGLKDNVEALTINKMCGSGLKAIMLGDQAIQADGANFIIAGGMESMTNAPYLIKKNLSKLGNAKMIDSLIYDGLWDAYNNLHMGSCAEMLVKDRKYTREEQDQFAIDSYKKAHDAQKNGYFNKEITVLKNSKGISIALDEEPGRAKFDKVPKISPAFEKNGTITAANASKLNDGAAAVLLCSAEAVKSSNIKPIAKIIAHCSYANDPKWFTTAPSGAIKNVLDKAGLSKNDIDIWEINEAFSVVAMAAIDDFNLDKTTVNIHGGAVALGHPIGASGARILVTLINTLDRLEKRIGLATLCIGGGEASAMIIEKL